MKRKYWLIPLAGILMIGAAFLSVHLEEESRKAAERSTPRLITGEEARMILKMAASGRFEVFESGQSVRASLIIAGKIAQDHPRLTKAKVKEILREMEALRGTVPYSEAVRRFREALDAVAGGPDFEGGSGQHIVEYAADDGMTEIFSLWEGMIGISWSSSDGNTREELGHIDPW